MTMLAVELLWGDKPVDVGDVVQFIAQVRAAGARDRTVLKAALSDDDYRQQIGWRAEVVSRAHPPEAEVTLTASFARKLLELLDDIADCDDGNVYSFLSEIGETRDELRGALLDRAFGIDTED